MKIAVIGAGSIGKRHIRNNNLLKEKFGITEIKCFDNNEGRLKEIKEEVNDITICNSLEETVKDVQALFICIPTSLHIPLLKDISKYGKYHIYLEKPLSHTLQGCEELIFNQKKFNKTLAVGYLLPKHPVLIETKKMINNNIIGKTLSVRAESGFYLPSWHPWEDYKDFYMSWKTGGGGAVTLKSSMLPGAKIETYKLNHVKIHGSENVFGRVEEYLLNEGTISETRV